MNSKKNVPQFFYILLISIASWFIFAPLLNQIKLPFGESHNDIISVASVNNISPYTDYLKFFGFLLIPSGVAAIALTLKRQKLEQLVASGLGTISHPKLLQILTPIFLLSWVIFNGLIDAKNWSIPDWGSQVVDTFHEGEFIGLLPNFLHLEKPFLHTFFIHGFGLDALPGILAHQLATQDNTLALTRFFYLCESAIAFLACLWIVWEIVASIDLKSNRLKVFVVCASIYCFLENCVFKVYGGRDALFLIQLALTVRFFNLKQTPKNQQDRSKLFLSFLIGASLPLGFLHTYDRAAYFVLVYLFTSVLSIFLHKRLLTLWIGGSAIGLILSSILIVSILGWDQAAEILNQVSYWSKYGKYLAFQPYPNVELNYISFLDWFPILFLASVLVYFVWKYYEINFSRRFWTENFLTLILFIAALSYMRILIDRSPGMGVFSALPTSFLATELALKFYQQNLESHFSESTLKPTLQGLVIFTVLAAIVADPGFNIFYNSRQLGRLYQSLWVADSELISEGYKQAFNAVKPDIDRQSCFYTLTSEGIWYYLFDKPSCSKLNYTYYVRPTETQEFVVGELTEKAPNIILLTNAMWSNAIDQIPIADSASLIYQYVITHYQPDRLIASHWFWKKREKPLKLSPEKTGNFGRLVALCPSPASCQPFPGTSTAKIQAQHNNFLSGVAVLPDGNRPADAVYLSYGDRPKLISVASVNPDATWQLPIPAKALPPEVGTFRVWGYDASKNRLLPIGSSFELKVKIS